MDSGLNESAIPIDPYSFSYGNTTDASAAMRPEIYSLIGVCLLVICCFGTVTNLAVLYCAWKVIQATTCNVAVNFLHQYFIVSMTVADLAFVSVYASAMFLQYSFDWMMDVYACGFVYFVCHSSTVASSLSLLCLNIDKFIAVIRPLHHNSIITRCRVWILLLICWSLSISWASFFISTVVSLSFEHCGRVLATFENYCVFTVLFFILPTLCSAVLSFIIGSIACASSDQSSPSQKPMTKLAGRGGSNGADYRKVSKRASLAASSNESKSQRYRLAINRFRTLIFVFATTTWSFVTCLPYRFMYLSYLTMNKEERSGNANIAYVLFVVMASNPLGNPIITFLTQRRYRKVVSQLFRTFCRRMGFRVEMTGNGRNLRHQTWSIVRNGTFVSGEEIEFGAAARNKKLSRSEF